MSLASSALNPLARKCARNSGSVANSGAGFGAAVVWRVNSAPIFLNIVPHFCNAMN